MPNDFLQESDRQFWEPRDFLDSLRADVLLQVDVCEFLNLLMDRLESCLRPMGQVLWVCLCVCVYPAFFNTLPSEDLSTA